MNQTTGTGPIIDFAVRQFLHKRFVLRDGFDRVGRSFLASEVPLDDKGWSDPEAAFAQSLSVERLISQGSNPSDDVYLAKCPRGKQYRVQMQWLRLYWREVVIG